MGDVVNQVTGAVFGSEKAPRAPNYTAAAEAEAEANKQAVLTSGAFNRPTQITPTGSQSWSLKEGADPNNPQPGDWIATTEYSPEQQALYLGRTGAQQSLVDAAGNAAGGVGNLGVGQGFDMSQIAPNFTGDVSKTAGEFSTDRQQIADALYSDQTKYLGEQFGQNNETLRSQLLSRGLTEGSAAYDTALRNQTRTQNEAYQSAANDAVTQSAQMQKLMQDALLNSAQTQQGLYLGGLQGEGTERTQPLNEILAMLQGGQVSQPNLQQYGQYGQYEGANYMDASKNWYSDKLAGAKFNNDVNSENMQQMAQMAMALMSDRRLKSNIRPLCRLRSGQVLYTYHIFGQPSAGVMADETDPKLVHTHASGYSMVDYSGIEA